MNKPFEPEDCWNCEKLYFEYEDDAWDYADYLFEKHGYCNTVYWSRACECYHLTSTGRFYRRGNQ